MADRASPLALLLRRFRRIAFWPSRANATRLRRQFGLERLEERTLLSISPLQGRTVSCNFAGQSLALISSVDQHNLPVLINPATGGKVVATDEISISLEPGLTPDEVAIPDMAGYRRLAGTTNQFVVTIPGSSGLETIGRANALGGACGVLWAVPNFLLQVQTASLPNDPLFGEQWTLHNTGQLGGLLDADADLPGAWNVTTGSPSVVIAVLDNGVEITHPDLAENIFVNPFDPPGNGDEDHNGYVDDVSGWDFVGTGDPTFVADNDPSPATSYDTHGTPVAGIAAAVGDNALGVTGAAPHAKIMPVKISRQTSNDSGFAPADRIAEAIYYAAGRTADGTGVWRGADVLVCSWVLSAENPAITDAIRWATTSGRGGLGTAVFCATGNDALAHPGVAYPASLPETIAVGASTDLDQRADYSQYGAALDIVAPSSGGTHGVATTDRMGGAGWNTASGSAGDYTNTFSGTSAAAPLAAGIAALMLTINPGLSAAQIREILHQTADKIGPDAYAGGRNDPYGFGRVNASAAVQLALPPHPGVMITATGGANTVVEGGAGDAYQVVLTNPPTAEVTIRLTPDRHLAAADDANPANPFLVFTPANWNAPQTVRIAAVNDRVVQSPAYLGTVGHYSQSDDPDYSGITIDDVIVSITDDDGPPAVIGGRVFGDLNRNDIRNTTEPGVPDATVRLYWAGPDGVLGGGDDLWQATRTTAAGGTYEFDNLPAGGYYLQFTLPAGTLAGSHFCNQDIGGDDALDSDVAPGTGITDVFTIATGQTAATCDAGIVYPETLIGNRAWNDIDRDGIQDSAEPGLGGATVELYYSPNAIVGDGDDVFQKQTTTDSEGYYWFADPSAGLNYYLKFRAPTGDTTFFFSPPHATANGSMDSDANAAGLTGIFNLLPSENNLNVDAGLIESALLHFGSAWQMGGEASAGKAVAFDAVGNGYLLGTLTGTADFDPNNGTVNLTANAPDASFLTKYSATGALLWAFNLFEPLEPGSYAHASALVRGADGSLWIGGEVHGTMDFDHGTGTAPISTAGIAGFLSKYDPAGNLLWAGLLGEGSTTYLDDLNVSADGYIYAAGRFYGTADFDPGEASLSLTAAGGADAFLVKLDASAHPIWASAFGGPGTDNILPSAVAAAADGGAWLTGSFRGTANFDPLGLASDVPSMGGNDIFIMKLDSTGGLALAHAIGGASDDAGTDLVVGADGSVYLGGDFTGTVDFDPGADAVILSAAGASTFAMKLDAGGGFAWARQTAATGGKQLAADSLGNIYAAGHGISKFSPAGNLMWEGAVAGAERSANSVTIGPDGAVHFTGAFRGAADFDPGAGRSILTTEGGENLFFATWTQSPISGVLWNDVNGNGLQDAGEPGIADASVKLWSSANSLIGDADDVLRETVQTDVMGRYYVPSVIPQKYYLAFSRPADDRVYAFTTQDAGDEQRDSDADAFGRTALFVISSSTPMASADAGLGEVRLGDFVWEDLNQDGVQTPNEAGLQAVQVDLVPASGGSAVATATSDHTGHYGFSNFLAIPGEYYLRFKAPSGFRLTRSGAGMDPTSDSDADPSTGRTPVFSITAGLTNLDYDAGMIGEAPKYVWNAEPTATGSAECRTVTISPVTGGLVTAGQFANSIDFAPGIAGGELTSHGGKDVFVLSYATSGVLLWAKGFGGTGDDVALASATGADGSVFVTGSFSGNVEFSGNGTDLLISQGGTDVFLLKLDRNGNFLWVRGFGGAGNDLGAALDVDDQGNIYLTGGFFGTAQVGRAPHEASLSSAGDEDIFAVSFDSSGDLRWARSMGGAAADEGRGLAVASDRVAVTGSYRGMASFVPGEPASQRQSVGGSDIFLASFDFFGGPPRVLVFGGLGDDSASAVTIDTSGAAVLTGSFRQDVDFNPGGGAVTLTSDSESEDAFVAKYDSADHLLWARRIGGSGADRGNGVTHDSDNGIYVAGLYEGTVDFDPSDAGVRNYTSRGAGDMFTLKLDGGGNFRFVRVVGGVEGNEEGFGVAVDPVGHVYGAGSSASNTTYADPDSDDPTGTNSNGTSPQLPGYLVPNSISGYFWDDSFRSNTIDGDDLRIINQPVRLLSGNGAVLVSDRRTYVNGAYFFDCTQWLDGSPYDFLVEFDAPAGYQYVTRHCAGADPNLDSEVDSGGRTGAITLQPGEYANYVNAGAYLEAPNHPPIVGNSPATLEKDQDLPVSGDLLTLAGVSDEDRGDNLQFKRQTSAAHGVLNVAASGAFSYQPDAGYYGSDGFAYIVTDGRGGTATGSVALTIRRVTPDHVRGMSGNDTFRIASRAGDSTKADVFFNNTGAVPNYSMALSDVPQWDVQGGDGDDALTVDFSLGNPLPPGGLAYDGGAAGSSGNALIIRGAAGDESISVIGSRIEITSSQFAGTAIIEYSNVRFFAFELAGGSNSLAVDGATVVMNRDYGISGGATVRVINNGRLDLNGFLGAVRGVEVESGGSIVGGRLTGTSYSIRDGNITSSLMGSCGVVKDTPGIAALRGSNYYTGGTTVLAGVLRIESANALPAGGSLNIGAGAAVVLSPDMLTSPSEPPAEIAGTEGDDTIRIIRSASDATKSEVFVNAAAPIILSRGGGQLWYLSARAGNDRVIVDYARGDPLPELGLYLNGGAQVTADSLVIAGTTGSDNVVVNAGGITVNGGALIAMENCENLGFDLGTGPDNLRIDGESVLLGWDNAISAQTIITLASEGSLDLGKKSLTVQGVTLLDGRITTGNLNAGSYAVQRGVITANLAGPAELLKNAGGTVSLGGGNLYDGGTTVNEGTLLVTQADAIPPGGRLTIGAGGTVVLDAAMSMALAGADAQAAAVAVSEERVLSLPSDHGSPNPNVITPATADDRAGVQAVSDAIAVCNLPLPPRFPQSRSADAVLAEGLEPLPLARLDGLAAALATWQMPAWKHRQHPPVSEALSVLFLK